MITYGSDCSGLEAPYIALCNILGGNNVRHIFSCDSDKNVQMSIKANFVPEIFTDKNVQMSIKANFVPDFY